MAGVAGAVLVSYGARAIGREAIVFTEFGLKLRLGYWAGPVAAIRPDVARDLCRQRSRIR